MPTAWAVGIFKSIFKFWFRGYYIDKTNGLFCTAFSKAVALRGAEPRGLSAHSISFLQSFFVFGFAKQMADVSQTRKNVALRAKKKALKDF